MTTNSINYQNMLSNVALNQSKIQVHVATAKQQEAEAQRILALLPSTVSQATSAAAIEAAKAQYAQLLYASEAASASSAAKIEAAKSAYANQLFEAEASQARSASILAASRAKYADQLADAEARTALGQSYQAEYAGQYARESEKYIGLTAFIDNALIHGVLAPGLAMADAAGKVLGGIGKLGKSSSKPSSSSYGFSTQDDTDASYYEYY